MSEITLQEMVSVPVVMIDSVIRKLFHKELDVGHQPVTHTNILRDVNSGSKTKQSSEGFCHFYRY